MKKIFAISLIAMTAVSAANAQIASKDYVDTNFQGKALITKTSGFENSDYVTTTYPSMATAKAIADAVAGGVGGVALTGYSKGNSAAAVTASDTINSAVSKLENQIGTKITANAAITGATKTKITYDANGLVTAGADLAASDIPELTLSKISDAGTAAAKDVAAGITSSETGLATGAQVYNYVDGLGLQAAIGGAEHKGVAVTTDATDGSVNRTRRNK